MSEFEPMYCLGCGAQAGMPCFDGCVSFTPIQSFNSLCLSRGYPPPPVEGEKGMEGEPKAAGLSVGSLEQCLLQLNRMTADRKAKYWETERKQAPWSFPAAAGMFLARADERTSPGLTTVAPLGKKEWGL